MAGTVVADTLQADSTSTLVLKNGVANTPPTVQDSAGTQIGTFCRAWVNFDGTTNVGGFCTIRASFNVSSVADNGTGDYTVNFTTAMADGNYAWFGMAKNVDGAANFNYPSVGSRSTATPAAGSIRIGTAFQQAASAADFAYVYVSIFR